MDELTYSTKIYYDDTDAAGVVYFSNYLKFCERAKQEFFVRNGCDLFKLHEDGIYLVVKEVRAKYVKSIKLGDYVKVFVSVKDIKRASAELGFKIFVNEVLVAEIDILSASVSKDIKIVKLPECVKKVLYSKLRND